MEIRKDPEYTAGEFYLPSRNEQSPAGQEALLIGDQTYPHPADRELSGSDPKMTLGAPAVERTVEPTPERLASRPVSEHEQLFQDRQPETRHPQDRQPEVPAAAPKTEAEPPRPFRDTAAAAAQESRVSRGDRLSDLDLPSRAAVQSEAQGEQPARDVPERPAVAPQHTNDSVRQNTDVRRSVRRRPEPVALKPPAHPSRRTDASSLGNLPPRSQQTLPTNISQPPQMGEKPAPVFAHELGTNPPRDRTSQSDQQRAAAMPKKEQPALTASPEVVDTALSHTLKHRQLPPGIEIDTQGKRVVTGAVAVIAVHHPMIMPHPGAEKVLGAVLDDRTTTARALADTPSAAAWMVAGKQLAEAPASKGWFRKSTPEIESAQHLGEVVSQLVQPVQENRAHPAGKDLAPLAYARALRTLAEHSELTPETTSVAVSALVGLRESVTLSKPDNLPVYPGAVQELVVAVDNVYAAASEAKDRHAGPEDQKSYVFKQELTAGLEEVARTYAAEVKTQQERHEAHAMANGPAAQDYSQLTMSRSRNVVADENDLIVGFLVTEQSDEQTDATLQALTNHRALLMELADSGDHVAAARVDTLDEPVLAPIIRRADAYIDEMKQGIIDLGLAVVVERLTPERLAASSFEPEITDMAHNAVAALTDLSLDYFCTDARHRDQLADPALAPAVRAAYVYTRLETVRTQMVRILESQGRLSTQTGLQLQQLQASRFTRLGTVAQTIPESQLHLFPAFVSQARRYAPRRQSWLRSGFSFRRLISGWMDPHEPHSSR